MYHGTNTPEVIMNLISPASPLSVNSLTSGWYGSNFKSMIFDLIKQNGALAVKLLLGECYRNLLMGSQHWVWRHQAITWDNVAADLCQSMASLGNNELNEF